MKRPYSSEQNLFLKKGLEYFKGMQELSDSFTETMLLKKLKLYCQC